MKKSFRIIIAVSFIVSSAIIFMSVRVNNIRSKEDYKDHYNRLNDLYSKVESKTKNFEEETLYKINKTNDKLKLAEYYDALTRYYTLNNNLQMTKLYSDKTMKEYSKVKNEDNYILNAFKNACILDIWQVDGSKSLNYYNRMLDVAKKKSVIKNSDFTSEDIEGLSYAMLTIFYSKSNNLNKAKEYYDFLNGLDNNNINDKEIGYIITYAKSMYNINFGDVKEAEQDMTILSEQMDSEPVNLMYIKPTIYLSTSIMQINNSNFKNALISIDKAIKLSNDMGDYSKNDMLIDCYLAYGMYYDKQDIFEKAKENYEKALDLSEKFADNIGAIRSVGSLIDLSERSNKFIDNKTYYKKFWKLSNVKENSAESYVSSIISLNDQLNNERISIIENEKKTEIEKHELVKFALIITAAALVVLSLGIYRLHYEIKLRKESESKLRAIINEDYLTKAYTRGYGYKNLKCMVESKKSIYLAMVDLDDYKKINDNFGHNVGDRVLVDFVNISNGFLKGEDFISRFGGEEFVIVLKDKTKEEVVEILENIRKTLENKEWNVEGLKVTVSIGLAYNKYEEVDMLIKKADDLLYIAKKKGKNRIQA